VTLGGGARRRGRTTIFVAAFERPIDRVDGVEQFKADEENDATRPI
jgi:hypothetical protein